MSTFSFTSNLFFLDFVILLVLFSSQHVPYSDQETYLLQAEEQFSEWNFDLAEKLYDDAILSSRKHRFLNEEALANELAGHFYRDTGRKEKSSRDFSQAEDKYREWGAIAKADAISQ